MASLVVSRPFALLITVATTIVGVTACSSSDSGNSGGTSGGGSATSGGTGTSGGASATSGGTGGSCSGDIASCPVGTLSAAQQDDMCSILGAAIDDPPGTKLECMGTGTFLVVNSKADCVAKPAPKTCKLTVTALVACFKAAKQDACGAFASGGACAPLFDPASGCGG